MSFVGAMIGGVVRDLRAAARGPWAFELPASFSPALPIPKAASISDFPTWHDQGQISTCVEQSICERYEHLIGDRFSAMFGWWFARLKEGGRPDVDDGITIDDALLIAQHQGVCRETSFPYDENNLATPPTLTAILEALGYRAQTVDVVHSLTQLKSEIAGRQPVMLGFDVPESASSDDARNTGFLPVPSASDPKVGRHAVNAIGYDDARAAVRCTSHWGRDWGDQGCLWLPYSHWDAGSVADMRAIRFVSRPTPVPSSS